MINNTAYDLFELLLGLHKKWMPHDGQAKIGHALFYEMVNEIFVDAGRNGGKTDVVMYLLWRYAKQFPGTENYLFEPQQKQAREIVWSGQRIQSFGPTDWIQSINNTEMRITFTNGSFIKVDGSDNFESYRGVKPKGLSIYDEVKDIKKAFFDAYEPNRAAFNSPAIWIGTPPEFPNHYDEKAEEIKNDPEARFFWFPSWANPHISHSFIRKKFHAYKNAGDIETWLREYAGLPIRGGKKHIFPQFLRYKLKKLKEIQPKGLSSWTLVVGLDPSTSSTFGVLFALHNPFTKKLILVDNIYEQTMANMTARKIHSAVNEIIKKWNDAGVTNIRWVYDEAAAWFANEVYEIKSNKWNLEKTQKALNNPETGISIIRTLFDLELIEVASECKDFVSEMTGYVKDDKGRLPKDNDHLIDCLRYIIHALGYDLSELEKLIVDLDLKPRFSTIEKDLIEDGMFNQYAEIGEE